MPQSTANVANNAATSQHESLVEKRHAQNYEMMKRYTEDRHQLWLAQADRTLSIGLKPFDRHNFFQEQEYGGYAIHWEGESFDLTVHPFDTDDYKSWAIFNSTCPEFTAASDRAIAFLKLDFSSADDRDVEFTLQDAFYWIDGAEVIAAGIIDRVLYTDIIVAADGLIIPIIVKPFVHHFKAFDVSAAVGEEHQYAYLKYLEMREAVNEKFRSEHVAPTGQINQLPSFAKEIDFPLSLDLLIHIQSDYDTWKKLNAPERNSMDAEAEK